MLTKVLFYLSVLLLTDFNCAAIIEAKCFSDKLSTAKIIAVISLNCRSCNWRDVFRHYGPNLRALKTLIFQADYRWVKIRSFLPPRKKTLWKHE